MRLLAQTLIGALAVLTFGQATQAATGPGGGAGGGSATNAQPPSTILTNLSGTGALTNQAYMRPDLNMFWDEFDGRSMVDGTNMGVSPSGHRWYVRVPAGNSMAFSNGMWRAVGDNTNDAAYAAISNSVHKYTRWGGKMNPVQNVGGFNQNNFIGAIILSDNFPLFGDDPTWLHVAIYSDLIGFGKGLAVNMHTFTYPTALAFDRGQPVQFQIVSNTCFYSIGPYTGSFTDPELHLYGGNGKTFTYYEIYTPTTNNILQMWDSAWAGYADPDLADKAAYSMTLIGTNMWAVGRVDQVSQVFSNTFVANSGGVSNILFEIEDGQKIEIFMHPATGVTVGYPQLAAANMLDGSVPTISTNQWSLMTIWRRGAATNALYQGRLYGLVPGSNVTFTTNHVTGEITIASTPGGDSPVIVKRDGTHVAASNSTAEVTLLTWDIPAFALGSNSNDRFELVGDFFNGVGNAATNFTLRIKAGDTVIAQDASPQISTTAAAHRWFMVGMCAALNSTNEIYMSFRLTVGPADGAAIGTGELNAANVLDTRTLATVNKHALGLTTNNTISITVSNQGVGDGAAVYFRKFYGDVLRH